MYNNVNNCEFSDVLSMKNTRIDNKTRVIETDTKQITEFTIV